MIIFLPRRPMKSLHFFIVASLFFIHVDHASSAQTVENSQKKIQIAPGARVRVMTKSTMFLPAGLPTIQFVGTFEALRGDTLFLQRERTGAPMVVPLSSIEKLEMSVKKRHVARGAKVAL